MLRRRARAQVFAPLLLETGRNGHGWPERDARVFAARRGRDTHAEQEAARGAFSAWRGGRSEYRGSLWRIELLPHASDHRDSTTKAWRRGCSDRPRRIFWLASEPRAARDSLSQESARRCACRRLS